ncbi:hypothetical protein [Endozoicomonas sp. ALD040]|uniref:hypothetical protein n=1 Tax=unclassified Endozoicomonas TaxID=2644528 RepID=UPI003BB1F614
MASMAHCIAPGECQSITDGHIVETLQNTGKLKTSRKAIVDYAETLKDACNKTLERETRSGHRFMILELLPKLLEANPEKRYTAGQALNHRCFKEELDNPITVR